MDKTELYARDISGARWTKSRYSEADLSVEVTVWGSNNPGRPDPRFTASEWAAFVDGIRDGEF
jgi:hypothetical protein